MAAFQLPTKFSSEQVNSDCRQLARSRHSPLHILIIAPSPQLLSSFWLLKLRKESSGVGKRLGRLQERVYDVYAYSYLEIVCKNRLESQKSVLNFHKTMRCRLCLRSPINIWPKLRMFCLIAMCCRISNPQLEKLILASFYNAMAASSVHQLKLGRPSFDLDFQIHLPKIEDPGGWPLRTLHMDLGNASTPLLVASMLRICAPTLETLTWSYPYTSSNSIFAPGSVPTFPHLRHLRLESFLSSDTTTLEAFPNAPLISLSLGSAQFHDVGQTLRQRGCIPTLRVLVTQKPPIRFLQANTQLFKIDMVTNYGKTSAKTVPFKLLPLLATFSNLTSLRLVWPEKCSSLSKERIEAIGKLHSLNQLCIVCGISCGEERNWVVDHEELRAGLSNLKQLRIFALQDDTYINTGDPKRQYIDKFATAGDLGYNGSVQRIPVWKRRPMVDATKGKPYWEHRHRSGMRTEAMRYHAVFPCLEWIFLGDRVISVAYNQPPGISTVGSAEKIKSQQSFLAEIFSDCPESAQVRVQ